MALRNIQVGDNLSGKTLYFSFPSNLTITNGSLIQTGGYSYNIRAYNSQIRVYDGSFWSYTDVISLSSLTLSDSFGTVTSIDSTNEAFQYIQIDDDGSTANTYTVTFEDEDGTVLKTQTVTEGGSATPPSNPSKASTSQYRYTFAGWSGSYTNVTSNVTVTATYTATPILEQSILNSSVKSIKVYEADETLFNHNGLKILKPYKAIVYKEDNGDYYLEIEDSIDNIAYYQQGYIIRVSTPWGEQGFRISNPTKKNRKITIKAWHLFYDSAKYVIEDSNVVDKSCNDALDHLNTACDQLTPFSTISDITSINSFRCVRKSFEEAVNTVLERWGGHLDRDNFKIEIRDTIGQDRGVVLAYGKNIESIEAKENWDNVVT